MKEGLEVYARALLDSPTRNDIDELFVPPQVILRPGVSYFDAYDWEFTVKEKKKIRLRMKELFKNYGR